MKILLFVLVMKLPLNLGVLITSIDLSPLVNNQDVCLFIPCFSVLIILSVNLADIER